VTTVEGNVTAQFLEKYLEHGFSQIAVVESDFSQSSSSHVETTDGTIVAKKGDKFVKVHVHEYIEFLKGPHQPPSLTVNEISESEYTELSAGKEIADTPQALAALQEDREGQVRRQALHEEFIETAPNCPKCNERMTSRKGPRGQFWGCSNYPKCKGTANFSAESRRKYDAYVQSLKSS
jgi:hypothetical protein